MSRWTPNPIDNFLARAFGGEGGLLVFKIGIYSMALSAIVDLPDWKARLALLVGMTFSALAGMGMVTRSHLSEVKTAQSDDLLAAPPEPPEPPEART